MRRTLLALFAAFLIMTSSAWATATSGGFTNGPLVARKMEAHYNGAAYKRSLAKSGAKLTTRVLCADAGFEIDCTGKMRVRGVAVKAEWELQKLGRTRARLDWMFTGKGIFQADHEIIAPKALGLATF